MWENIDNHEGSAHYSILRRKDTKINGMELLRAMFPDAHVDELNFVLFSTSGVHGTYNTIEDAEKTLAGLDNEGIAEVTFLIVHPRLVALRYGNCEPETQEDIEYLKKLRKNSHEVVAKIGVRSC